jgi:hypothetical protein
MTRALTGTALGIFGIGDIVYDPKTEATLIGLHAKSETSKLSQFIEEMARWKEQIDSAREHISLFKKFQGYWEEIHGTWKKPLEVLKSAQADLINGGVIDTQGLGWGDENEFRKVATTRTAVDALDQLRAVLNSKANIAGLGKIRDSIEEIYGDVPVTRRGVAVEAAYREVGTATAFVGEVNKAIVEKRDNIARLKQQISSGTLAPGDIERIMTVIATEEADVALLQTQIMNQGNRLAVQTLGLQAGLIGNSEHARLRDRANRLEMMRRVRFGPGEPSAERGGE